MKGVRIYLTGILLIAVAICGHAQTTVTTSTPAPPHPPYKYYDYISIVVWGETPNTIYVSYNGFAYRKIKIFDKVEGDYDYNQAFNLINEYEQDGFELYANNFIPHAYVNPGTNYFLLRKEHKDDKDKDKEKEKLAAHSSTN